MKRVTLLAPYETYILGHDGKKLKFFRNITVEASDDAAAACARILSPQQKPVFRIEDISDAIDSDVAELLGIQTEFSKWR
jgi:hypothetical protein